MIVIGIDPGYGGAFSVLEYSHPAVSYIGVVDAPIYTRNEKRYLDPRRMVDFFDIAFEGCEGPHIVVIEAVGARPGQGVSSMFRFGYGAGLWHGVAAGFKSVARIEFVTAQAWKAAVGVTADKETSLARAREWFPGAERELKRRKDEGRAEALLIAQYFIDRMKLGKEPRMIH